MKALFKKIAIASVAFFPAIAFAQDQQDGTSIIVNAVEFLGVAAWGLIAAMIFYGAYSLWVFGTGLQKMGNDENPQEKPKPRSLMLSLLAAIVCTYGTYTLGVAMRTLYDNPQQGGVNFNMPDRPGQSNSTGG